MNRLREKTVGQQKIEAVKVTCDAQGCSAEAFAQIDPETQRPRLPQHWVEGFARQTGYWGKQLAGDFLACGTAHIRKAVDATLRTVTEPVEEEGTDEVQDALDAIEPVTESPEPRASEDVPDPAGLLNEPELVEAGSKNGRGRK